MDNNNEEKFEKKNPFINLPAKFILTELGEAHFFKRNIPLRELPTYDGRRGFGFFWPNYNAKLVQKLVIKKFFKEICIERSEFLSQKADITDLTKLIVYGILYEEVSLEIANIFIKSEMVEMLNAKNPKSRITLESSFNQKVMDDFFKNHDDELQTLRKVILMDPYALIDDDNDLNAREKEMRKNIVKNFLEAIDSKSWFLFHFICKSVEKVTILNELNDVIISYLKKTKIADYIALMLLELAAQGERANFEKLAKSKKLLSDSNFEDFFSNPENRTALIQIAEKTNQNLILDYKLSERTKEKSGKHYVLTVTMINSGLVMEKRRREMKEKIDADAREKNLVDFFKNMSPEKMASSGMGMFYLSFLEEACEQEKIKFDAKIICDDKKEETLFIISVHF